MRAALLIVCAVLACAAASAKEAVWAIPATVTTSAVTRTSDCQVFVGDLDEVTLYGATSATGTISSPWSIRTTRQPSSLRPMPR